MSTTLPSIAEQSDGVKSASADRLPADVRAAFGANLAELKATGVPTAVATPGTVLADVSLIDAHGTATSLHAVSAGRPAVLVFYRGAWCPYCNVALRTYGEQLLPQLTERGVALIAISPQKPDGSLTMQEKHELTFPVLSDPGNLLAGQLGILTLPHSDEVRAAQEQLGLVVGTLNADGTDTLPMPTVVIADAQHTIRWIDVHPDYTTRSEVPDILTAVDGQLGRR